MPDTDGPPTRGDTAAEVVQALVSQVPVAGDALAVMVRHGYERRVARAEAVAGDIAERAGGVEHLATRMEASQELEALFCEALEASARTGMEDKRRLLGQVVAAAVLDDAEVDEGQLLVQVLRELDAPHLRGLEAVRRVSDPPAEPDGYRVSREAVLAAVAGLPEPLRAALVRTGTLEIPSAGIVAADPYVTRFGRRLLDDLKEAAGASAASPAPEPREA